jgi:MFS family permease
VIVFAVTLAILTYVDRVSISYAALFIRRDLGLSHSQMSWVFGAFGLAYAIFEMPGGYLGDRLGPRGVLLRIVLWWSFFTAATGRAWNLTSLVTARFMFGAGEAGCFPNLTKAFTTWLPEREKVRAQGIMWLSTRWGGAFTPLLVALVMSYVGWRNAFAVFGLAGFVWAALFYRWYRNDPRDNARLNDAERRLIGSSATLAAGHGDVPWRRLLRSRQVWMLCWQYFALSYGWYFYITWLPTYLREARHVQVSSTAWLGVLPLLLGGFGNLACVAALGWLRRRNVGVTRSRRIMATLGFAGAAAFLVFSTTRTAALPAMLAIAMASFCNDLVMPCAWGAAMDVGGKFAGTVSGAMNMWGNFAGFLAPVMIGHLLEWTHANWNLTFYVSAGVYLTGIVFWSLFDSVTPLER